QPWLLRQSFDEIVTEFSLPKSAMSEVVACLDSGQPVFSYAQFTENHFRKVPVRRIDDCWFLRASLLGLLPHYRVSKRMIDICIAIVGIVCSLPLLLIAAIAIKLTSRGPVFYQQTRVGHHNIPFSIYKLRSMTTSAEHHGAQWAKKADARITPVGRILRKTRIDEIPQFWNILKGDMAFIGPRPERPEFTGDLANHIPFYEKRHLVKPGLTGWAQINYPYGASVEDAEKKLEYDLFYVKHGSLALDFHILIRTIGAVMKGAR
ncbi:MAG: exopolysaccharide biosynthesis polyprenyl glycosylphosphotransferase, partial [Verrucomicrobiota bacterium]